MLDTLVKEGRKLVTIIDPHVKKDDDYFVYQVALEKNFYVKKHNKEPYVGQCWPGESIWLDYFNSDCRNYVKSLYTEVPP